MTTEPARSSRATTPLERRDLEGLIPTFVATWGDVELAERANIESAARWAFGRRRVATPPTLLTVEFSDRVHRKMFDGVWRWAGRHRAVDDPDGVRPGSIAAGLMTHFATARKQHDARRVEAATLALQLHDALLEIRAYPDGNRRHARFFADLYLHVIGEPRLEWSLLRADEPPTDVSSDEHLLALQAALDAAARPRRLQESLDRLAPRRR